MRIVEPSAELVWCTPEAERIIEEAGRTCYKSEDAITDISAPKFIEMIIQRGHESVLEHASASFRIITDRGITHEIVRHRIASYSQESTRYCNYGKEKFGKEITVIQPSGIADQTEQYVLWSSAMRACERAYFNLIDAEIAPQFARSVLPICLKTEIIMTCNFREWRHFLKLRLAKAAHPDIQVIAKQIWEQLLEEAPTVFLWDNVQ